MGGMGIRAVELARTVEEALGAAVAVAAASTDGTDLGVRVITFDPHRPVALRSELARVDAVVAQPAWPSLMRALRHRGCRLIFDLYDPEVFGTIENFSGWRRSLMTAYAGDRITAALRTADHVMCANERQRDLWLGAMLGSGLISPNAADVDGAFRTLIEVVPYGVPAAAPQIGSAEAVRSELGVERRDEVVLWNGGVWSWLDPATAIRAMALVRQHRPSARLVFMGSSSAGPAVRATRSATELSQELGLLGTGVLFNPSWVPYEHRAAWLAAADCAISTHADRLEARFASRTRLLDCFWAGLPIVCTQGDEIADRVDREDLGVTVPPEDPVSLAAALEHVLARGRAAYAQRLARAAADHTWPRVAKPLIRWLTMPSAPRRRGPAGYFERRPSELLRTGAYLVIAKTMTTTGLTPI
jgi:glycosyltransferase involved in cell wall biosynthesis